MNTRSRGLWIAIGAAVLGAIGGAWGAGSAVASDTVLRLPGHPQSAAALAARGTVETVHFGDRRASVKLVRGPAGATDQPARREVVSFGTGRVDHVTIVRGTIEPAASAPAPVRQAALGPQKTIEQVGFADPTLRSVTVVRGGGALRALFSVDLFGPANAGELERIAFAVHGVESSHGTNPRMWRPEFEGPQGPMQVSAKAAIDVGGGDRFDLADNRRLGRAYLARMFQRYGNWPDALGAYNWGPGNLDHWIAGGRNTERMPLETVRYIERVLRDALISRVASRL